MSLSLATLLALAAPNTAPVCGIVHPEQCASTNELVWDKRFEKAVGSFLGKRRTPYLYHDASVARQMLDVLGGPPDEPQRLGSAWLFTACRAHSCWEKGAAVVEPGGRVAALAMLHFDCSDSAADADCAANVVLTLFVRDGASERTYAPALTAWARKAVAADSIPSSPERLVKIETIAVGAARR